MKSLSSPISRCLLRHLSTTTATTTTTAPVAILNAKQNLPNRAKALQFYSSVANPFISPLSSRAAVLLAVERLAKARRFDDIETLIESLKHDPKITYEPYFCNLIRCYGKAGMFDHAIKLYDELEELGAPRSCFSFNSLLAAANDSLAFDRVRQLFDEMPERYGFDPNEVSYAILVRSYCLKGGPEMGLKIIEEMEGKGVEVTAVTLTTLMDAFYKKGKVDDAERVWGKMRESGCVPDIPAWNVKIGHAHAGQPEGVTGLIAEMERAGLKPDYVCYSYLLTCYCRNDRLDEAMKVFEDMENQRLRPKAATFRALILYLCEKEEYGKAYHVFRMGALHSKILDYGTLKVLVEGLVKNNMKEDAKGLIRTVKQQFPSSFMNTWNKLEAELGLV